MKLREKIFGFMFILFLMPAKTVFSQFVAYNDGLSIVFIGSGTSVTVDGSYVSQTRSAVDGQITNQGTLNITGDLSNNNSSSGIFSSSAGEVILKGSAAKQTITGTTDPAFYNLTLNSSYSGYPQFQLGRSISVSGALAMTSGNVNLASNTLTIGSSASSVGSLSRSTGILYNGYLKRWIATSTTIADGSSAGLFPIGSSADYRPFYVSAPSTGPTTGGTITASHTAGSVNPATVSFADGGSTVQVRTNHSWTVSTGNGLAGGTYNTRIEGTNLGTVGNVNDLRVTLNGSVVASAGTNGGTTSNPQINRTGLSVANLSGTFYVGSVDPVVSPLPIELLVFNAILADEIVNITWATGSEINNSNFTVEKTKDGEFFETVAVVKGAGNSSAINKYTTADRKPYSGISYYRLKQTDTDGKYAFSPMVTVNNPMQNETEFTVFPNPSDGKNIRLSFQGEKAKEEVLVGLKDMQGRFLFSKLVLTDDNGSFLLAIEPNKILSPGIYLIVGYSSTKTFSRKLAVE